MASSGRINLHTLRSQGSYSTCVVTATLHALIRSRNLYWGCAYGPARALYVGLKLRNRSSEYRNWGIQLRNQGVELRIKYLYRRLRASARIAQVLLSLGPFAADLAALRNPDANGVVAALQASAAAKATADK